MHPPRHARVLLASALALVATGACAQSLDAQLANAQAQGRTAALAAWATELQQAIRARWIRPDEKGLRYPCVLELELAPNGLIQNVSFPDACSDTGRLETSIQAAVLKAMPLPMPTDPSVFRRRLRLRFKPPEAAP